MMSPCAALDRGVNRYWAFGQRTSQVAVRKSNGYDGDTKYSSSSVCARQSRMEYRGCRRGSGAHDGCLVDVGCLGWGR